MSFDALRPRLTSGRPLVLDSDTGAAFRARGSALDTPGSLGVMLRERPAEIRAHYAAEVASRVDVLSALTADTTPRALAEVGMHHRAAALTSLAVELALEAAASSTRPVAVAGVLGSDMVTPIAADRLREELEEHAARLAAAGCELVIARGQGSQIGLMAAVAAAARSELLTFAVVECDARGRLVTGTSLSELVFAVADAGAEAVLFEVPSVDAGLECLSELGLVDAEPPTPGVLLGSSAESVRGFPDREGVAIHWVDRALELGGAGARIIGGGAGTTESHTRALAAALGVLHPSSPPRHTRELEGKP